MRSVGPTMPNVPQSSHGTPATTISLPMVATSQPELPGRHVAALLSPLTSTVPAATAVQSLRKSAKDDLVTNKMDIDPDM